MNPNFLLQLHIYDLCVLSYIFFQMFSPCIITCYAHSMEVFNLFLKILITRVSKSFISTNFIATCINPPLTCTGKLPNSINMGWPQRNPLLLSVEFTTYNFWSAYYSSSYHWATHLGVNQWIFFFFVLSFKTS